MKDSWGKSILYLFFLPLFLIIPNIISQSINSGMSIERYDLMVQAIHRNLWAEDNIIDDFQLTASETYQASFDYFTIYVGDQQVAMDSVAFLMTDSSVILYMSNVEIARISYEALGLESFDFNIRTTENARILASYIRTFYNAQNELMIFDIILFYFVGLFDYLFYALFMVFFSMLFIQGIQLPVGYRIKLSIYLTSIYVISKLIFMLFGVPQLEIISLLLVSIYHMWAYRSMRFISKGVM
jgi:hypothetical protein